MKFTYVTGTSFIKLIYIFHKIFIINTTFPPWPETLYAGRLKRFAEASVIFTNAVFQLVVFCKTASSECILQGGKKWKSWEGAKSGL
jgi:hypothetical protein